MIDIRRSTFSIVIAVMRIGKSLDMMQGALKSFYIEDTIYRLTLTISKLNQACYLLADHIIWAGKVGLVKTNTKKWAKVSARFWLVTIICCLIRNVYDILSVITASKRAADKKKVYMSDSTGAKENSSGLIAKCLDHHKPMVLDITKNVSDLFLPLSSLGYIKTSTGFQGLMGIIGSVVGILVVWNPRLKQSPA